jgi:hypothetical protein
MYYFYKFQFVKLHIPSNAYSEFPISQELHFQSIPNDRECKVATHR